MHLALPKANDERRVLKAITFGGDTEPMPLSKRSPNPRATKRLHESYLKLPVFLSCEGTVQLMLKGGKGCVKSLFRPRIAESSRACDGCASVRTGFLIINRNVFRELSSF